MSVATRVAQRYELVRPLGHGAMATVDLAQDVELDRPVALKRLAENLARDEELRRRFVREARLAARLAHPNVVRVFDVGEDDGRPFIAMEYVDGETLAEVVARRGALPPAEAAGLGMQICAGLAAAHAAGLVHRDVKPQNLLLGSDGVLKLGDFGIAVGHEGTRLTVAGTVLGTAGYLAPGASARRAGQRRGGHLRRRSRALRAADRRAVADRQSLAELGSADAFDPSDLTNRVPAVPAELVAAVTACLALRPEDRPESAAALARLIAPATAEAPTLSLPPEPTERATKIIARPAATDRRWPARRLAAAAALAAAALAGLVAALVLSSGGGHASPPASKPHRVAPPAAGSTAAQQARNLATWIRAHGG